jgi:putative FmdB family regulatory protein
MSGGDMPTYRYRCSECGEEFELWQSIKDDAIRTHDDGCGGEVLKVLTAAGIVLKGAGFYKTDSRSASKSKGSDGSQPKDDGGSSEPKPSPSSDSGAATKSGDATSTPTKTGDSKSTAGAAKPS